MRYAREGALATMESARVKPLSREVSSFRLKLAARCGKRTKQRLHARGAANSTSNVEEDVSSALTEVFEEAINVIKWNVFVIGMELKAALKRVSTEVKMETQEAFSQIWTEHEHGDSETLLNVAARCAKLHNRAAEVNGTLLNADRVDVCL